MFSTSFYIHLRVGLDLLYACSTTITAQEAILFPACGASKLISEGGQNYHFLIQKKFHLKARSIKDSFLSYAFLSSFDAEIFALSVRAIKNMYLIIKNDFLGRKIKLFMLSVHPFL